MVEVTYPIFVIGYNTPLLAQVRGVIAAENPETARRLLDEEVRGEFSKKGWNLNDSADYRIHDKIETLEFMADREGVIFLESR